jgi:hypothetical protein
LKPKRATVDFSQTTIEVINAKKVKEFKEQGEELGKSAGTGFDDVFGQMFEEAMKKATDKGLNPEQLANFQGSFKTFATIATSEINALGNAFNSFGVALVTGGNAMKSFADSLKQSFAQLVGVLIKDIALAGILSLISGGIGNGKAGVSFIGALGGLLSGIKGFATGGLAFGPTVGMIGEGRGTNRSNPEVIAPLNKLSQYIGNGNNSIEVFGRLSGNDILLSNARQSRRNNRVH